MYNEKVIKHFQNPLNNAKLADANAVGGAHSPICGDVIQVFLKIAEGKIQKATFETMGCSGIIASGSILTELVQGKTLEQAKKITGQTISGALGGLPTIKMHCPDLAAEALRSALSQYEKQSPPRPC